jgi:transketolase
MRTKFIEQLIVEAGKDDKIFLIVGDLGFSVVEPFANAYPDRFLNAGVAEQNMTGIAAGLAMEGYTVFTYSIANFPTLRCMEQIRYDVCYHNLNVKIVAVGGGYAYGSLGPSHHATEELGMLRTIPNLVVAAPGDPIETKRITTMFCAHRGPCYIRLGKAGEPVVHYNDLSFGLGQAIEVIAGADVAVLTTGSMLKSAHDHITKNALSFGLYSFPFVKPLDKALLGTIGTRYKRVITIEEHQAMGGFGSAVLEGFNSLVNEGKLKQMPRVEIKAIQDDFISISGSQQYLREVAGLVLPLA